MCFVLRFDIDVVCTTSISSHSSVPVLHLIMAFQNGAVGVFGKNNKTFDVREKKGVCVWINSTNSEENVKPNKKNNVKKNTYKQSRTIVLCCMKMKEKRMQREKKSQPRYVYIPIRK